MNKITHNLTPSYLSDLFQFTSEIHSQTRRVTSENLLYILKRKIEAYRSTLSTLDLTLKVPITTAADDIHEYFFSVFLEKIRLDVSSESSARQRIHLKIKPYFLRKIKVKN